MHFSFTRRSTTTTRPRSDSSARLLLDAVEGVASTGTAVSWVLPKGRPALCACFCKIEVKSTQLQATPAYSGASRVGTASTPSSELHDSPSASKSLSPTTATTIASTVIYYRCCRRSHHHMQGSICPPRNQGQHDKLQVRKCCTTPKSERAAPQQLHTEREA
jgi:hypothetical protein